MNLLVDFINFRSLFTALLYIDMVMMVVSFVFAYFTMKGSIKNKVYFNFGMTLIFVGLWMLTVLFDVFRLSPFPSVIHTKVSFVFGIWVAFFFVIFTFYFPFTKKLSKYYYYTLLATTILVSSFSFLGSFYVIDSHVDFPFSYDVLNPAGLSLYMFYFSFLAFLAFRNLFKSFSTVGSVYRKQLRLIFFGAIITTIANLVFSLGSYYFSAFDYTTIGIFFVSTFLFSIYLILFSRS